MKAILLLIVIAFLSGVVVTEWSINASAEESLIPPWIKTTAAFWADGQIGDAEFLKALQFLVSNGILIIPGESEPKPAVNDIPAVERLSPDVSRIDSFFVLGSAEDSTYLIRYTLLSPSQAQISEDGKVSVTIFDSVGDVLYSAEFLVTKSDFKTYSLVLTGQEVLAHAWEIPTSDVKSGVGAYGTTAIVFTDDRGNEFTSETSINIPELSGAELSSKFQTDFLKTATPINLLLAHEGLEIELKAGGVFTHLKYDTWGDKVTDYRIDAVIKNTSNESIRFSPLGSFLQTSDGRQFESNLHGTIEHGKILPESIVGGSILFEIDETLGQIKSIIIDDDYVFDLENNRAYTFEQIREETYNENSIKVGKTVDQGSFEITLVQVGEYSAPVFGTIVNGFRADFLIENVSREAEYGPTDVVLLDGRGNQYDKSFGSEMPYRKIQPGITYAGYAFFEDYPGDSPVATIVITENSYPDDYEWKWDVRLTR